MNEKSQLPSPADLLKQLESNPQLQRQEIQKQALDPQLRKLREWQSKRLAQTYQDLWQDPQYQQACQFFLEDIYAAKDFSQRDHDVERIYRYLSNILPETSLRLVKDGIDLNRLSHELDYQLLDVIVNQFDMNEQIDTQKYIQAYRLCDNYNQRLVQIKGISKVLLQVAEGAHISIVGIALTIAKKPVVKAGWGELFDFLDRGYHAFKKMKNPEFFVSTIEQREKSILDKIYAGDPHPF